MELLISQFAGVIQDRIVETVSRLIQSEIGEPDDIDAPTLAYAVVRVAESFYYRELLTGQPTDISAATTIIRRLLR
jgi:hypothetical protein